MAMIDAMTGLLNRLKDEFTVETYTGQLYRFTYAESVLSEIARRKQK
jgi:hypothetical protein